MRESEGKGASWEQVVWREKWDSSRRINHLLCYNGMTPLKPGTDARKDAESVRTSRYICIILFFFSEIDRFERKCWENRPTIDRLANLRAANGDRERVEQAVLTSFEVHIPSSFLSIYSYFGHVSLKCQVLEDVKENENLWRCSSNENRPLSVCLYYSLISARSNLVMKDELYSIYNKCRVITRRFLLLDWLWSNRSLNTTLLLFLNEKRWSEETIALRSLFNASTLDTFSRLNYEKTNWVFNLLRN